MPAEVSVKVGGKTYSRRVMVPSGDPRNPMLPAQRQEKFLDCTSGIFSDDAAVKLWTRLESLSEIKDLDEVFGSALSKAFASTERTAKYVN